MQIIIKCPEFMKIMSDHTTDMGIKKYFFKHKKGKQNISNCLGMCLCYVLFLYMMCYVGVLHI
jgi:hypothetical protein